MPFAPLLAVLDEYGQKVGDGMGALLRYR